MRRGIYSHTFGYLGGVSYAIMVAKICQDNPLLEVADLVYKFFEVYSEWKWLEAVSIKITKKKKDHLNIHTLGVLNAYSYDPMIIQTPISNPKNSAYRVTQFTFDTIVKELQRAKNIIKSFGPITFKKCMPSSNSTADPLEEQKTATNPEVSDPLMKASLVPKE